MNSSSRDMHQSEIGAKIKMRGSNLRQLSVSAGLSPATLRNVFYRPWPKAEKIIADFLEMDASEIWPSRYPANSDNKAA